MLPIYWLINMSFKTTTEIINTYSLWPQKFTTENYVKIFQEEYNLNYTIFRFFNTFGPNQSEDFVIPKFVKLALKNLSIPIYGNGLQTRTFLYIDDNIDTICQSHADTLGLPLDSPPRLGWPDG